MHRRFQCLSFFGIWSVRRIDGLVRDSVVNEDIRKVGTTERVLNGEKEIGMEVENSEFNLDSLFK